MWNWSPKIEAMGLCRSRSHGSDTGCSDFEDGSANLMAGWSRADDDLRAANQRASCDLPIFCKELNLLAARYKKLGLKLCEGTK
jgi:hypothetical protein